MPKRRIPKKRQPADVTRRKLLHAGAAAFASEGVGGARVVEIAKNAGIAVGTFYLYFKDKHVLFAEVMEDGIKQVVTLLASEGVRDGSPSMTSDRARNMRAMGRLVDFAVLHNDLFHLLLSRGGSKDPIQRSLIDMIAQLRKDQLETGKKEGRFLSRLHSNITARGEIGFAFHVLDWWIANPQAASRKEIIETLVDVRMFGVERSRPED